MSFGLAKNESFLFGLLLFISIMFSTYCFHANSMACNVSLTQSCPALLYYVPEKPRTLNETSSLFSVNSNIIHTTVDGFVISVKCSCSSDHNEFTWHIDYTVQSGDTWGKISAKFGSFVVEKPEKTLIPSLNVTLDLLCGCYESVDLLTYRVQIGDTLYTICSRLNADLDNTMKLNNLENAGLIQVGDLLFIPEPGGLQNLTFIDDKDPKAKKSSKSRIPVIVEVILAAVIVVLSVVGIIFWRYYYKRKGTCLSKASWMGMKYFPCDINSTSSYSKSEENIVSSFNSNIATVFPYNEVCDATSNFNVSLKIGQGSYGSVYLGKLRGKDVAIKQMKSTKSKEFLSELNILCQVHHTNLIELIGCAAGGHSLFLVYEFAQNGALSDHLHNLGVRGRKPLSWTTRVQIALDAAKGLEYIHLHTKPYYAHRDVKPSNILLDSSFRAKIADFGLVKLLEHSPEVRTAASRIVGTFGYLAPEYVRDGCVTTKSDVYSFGVVLMELLTGQPALSRDASPGNAQYCEHRSLVDYMLSTLENDALGTNLAKCVDPNLSHYHKDSLLQVAFLSKDCVDDDWNRRPDMCQVVVRLSNILVCSREWENHDCSDPTH